MEIQLRRVYDDPTPADGYRVLVDRLWPRGVSKERAALDEWAKDVAPTPDLRMAWHTAPAEQWQDFADRYAAELSDSPALAAFRDRLLAHDVVTFVYASDDPIHNHAVMLRDAVLTERA